MIPDWWHVGDSLENDVVPAQALGLRTVLLSRPGLDGEVHLHLSGADKYSWCSFTDACRRRCLDLQNPFSTRPAIPAPAPQRPGGTGSGRFSTSGEPAREESDLAEPQLLPVQPDFIIAGLDELTAIISRAQPQHSSPGSSG